MAGFISAAASRPSLQRVEVTRSQLEFMNAPSWRNPSVPPLAASSWTPALQQAPGSMGLRPKRAFREDVKHCLFRCGPTALSSSRLRLGCGVCPISQVLEPVAHRRHNDKEVLTEEGLGLMLSRSVSAADAAHRRPDQRTGRRVIRLGGDLRRGFSRPSPAPRGRWSCRRTRGCRVHPG